jgi:hypothetical protein
MKLPAGLCVLLLATAAQAAEVTVLAPEDEAGTYAAIIFVQGKLVSGDVAIFEHTVARIRKAIVFLESPGGDVNAGIGMGEAIRSKGFETAVADGAACASACAITWLGGSPRYMAMHAHVGFHAPVSEDDVSAVGNGLVGYYLHEIGLSQNAVAYVMKADPQALTYLTEKDSTISQIYFNALTIDQAKRYREALDARHEDPPTPVPEQAAGSCPIIGALSDATVRALGRELICAPTTEIKAIRLDEILAQAARQASSGDVAGARDMLSKFTATIDMSSAASIAFALAETYDPNMLAAWGIRDVLSDAVLARMLYRQAMIHEPLTAKARNRLAALGNN